jgi:hypothetical protein
LIGLGALAVPILIHLIQRERKRVIEFPSLMFVRRIPYQSVRRRRIRHWFLLLLRATAVALIVAAFSRPFFQQQAKASAVSGGARDIVILLDQSASMGYGDHWTKARDAARGVVRGMGTNDRATLVLFAKNAEENMRATSDRGRLEGAVNAAKVGSGATRYGPALKLAESILSRSPLKRRETVLISDFQKVGWTGSEEVHFPEGMTISTVSVASPTTSNLAVPSVTFGRTAFSGQQRVAVTAGLSNKGDQMLKDVPVTLTIDGHEIQTERATVAPHASSSVTFTQFTLAGPNVRGNVRAGSDPMPADNSFNFVLAPSDPVSVAIVDGGDRPDASLFLSKALGIGTTPSFHVDVSSSARVGPTAFDKRAAIILNDTMFPPAGGGGVLRKFVERGGGLLVVAGDRTSWPQGEAALLPGTLGATVDRTSGRSGSLGFLDYSHPVFEVFKAPRSGDFSASHVFRYRALQPARPTASSRFDDGAVAAADEGRPGARHRLDDDARRLVDGHRREADLPAAGAPAGALPVALRAGDVLVHRRSGAGPRRPRQRPRGPHRRHTFRRTHLPAGRGRRERRAARAERTRGLRGPQAGRADECAARVAGRQSGPSGIGALGDGSGGTGRGGDRSRDPGG